MSRPAPLRLLLPAFAFALAGCGRGGPDYAALHARFQAIADSAAPAEVAVAFMNLADSTYLGVNDTVTMHAASTMKVPVLIELFRQADHGRFSLDDSVEVHTRFTSIADGSTYTLPPETDSEKKLYELAGEKTTYRDLADRMIQRSSNLATNLLIQIVTADSVEATMHRIGADGMHVLRGVEDIPAFDRGMNNTTTARALARVMEVIARCEVTNQASCDEMIRILKGQEFNDKIPSGLPPGTPIAHKTGNITGIDHDAAIVYPPGHAPFVLVVMTRGFSERAQAFAVSGDIARAAWDAVVR
ncbi:MAG: class A beta-lactamase-related serine hydrolase [Gemmatimonadota bacterium]